MPKNELSSNQLKGWSNIAKYLGQSTATAQHWARSGMPVSREGRSVIASPEELRTWLARESGHEGAQIVTNETDLSAILKHGLKDARVNRKTKSAKDSAGNRQHRPRQTPAPKPRITSYSPGLPFSQVESRIAGLEKRLQQLLEFVKSISPSEGHKFASEIQSTESAVAHYRTALQIERQLAGVSLNKSNTVGHWNYSRNKSIAVVQK